MKKSNAKVLLAAVSAAAVATLFGVAGCAVGPNFKTPKTDLPPGWVGAPTTLPAMASTGPATGPSTNRSIIVVAVSPQDANIAQWWQNLNDPALDSLVAQALNSNY